MIEQDEVQIGRILRRFLRRDREETKRVGCPDDERLANYLGESLSEAERRELESHLASCAGCLDDLGAAYKAQHEEDRDTVPQRLLEKAMALIPAKQAKPDFLEVVVKLVRDSLELVSTSGQLAFATTAAEIRGKGKSLDSTILQVEKELGKFRIWIEVERTEGDLCQVVVKVKAKGQLVADGIRLSLVAGGREQASYLARQGMIIFDRIPPGEYRLALSEGNAPLGSVRLMIKEDHHER